VRFWLKVCSFFFVVGILSLILVSADHIFSLGIWHGHYPPTTTNATGESEYSTYGECMLYIGITVVVAGLLGAFLTRRLQRREMEAAMFLEMVRQQGIEEGREDA
jgi:di/tricarboxylate transporter